MPRINIEEEFWGDQRVERLKEIMGRFAAIGACVTAWRLAQKYWNGGCNGIPKEIWDTAKMPNELREVGLAFIQDGKSGPEVYVAGSKEHFEWYKRKCESAKIGGKASAAKRMAFEPTNAQPNVDECSTKRQPSSSSSSSSSSSKEIYTSRAVEIIKQLNSIAGTHHRLTTPASLSFITARMKEDPSLTDADFVDVIRVKTHQWKNDTKMRGKLRPQTLFNSEKFDSYLSEAKQAREREKLADELFGVPSV